MKIIRRRPLRSAMRKRRGLAMLELVLTLGTVFVFTVALYRMAVMSCHNLFQVIGGMVGSPYM
ncbi:hypothetical protein CA54_60070 [Symmachiella macrocystis]|uniref:Uncharacterized protein n=1 Tax=Symmachiella macrocystis TaxID=2527985 RepID=A0A5C6B1H3_9PLAN|nr:hypothetical protein [Symmachiella macrocystis]TWU05319.1 hypothetical protein CA54_60070 [Symmachiella macrocystis]